MKRLMNALKKAGFNPELVSMAYGEYYDGETQGFTCDAVHVEIPHKAACGYQVETLYKICRRYKMHCKNWNTYGFYGWSATVYEIIPETDYSKAQYAEKIQEIAMQAFYGALREGKTDKEALQAIKQAVAAA